MANESKKDFNAMMNDNKDMPKIKIVEDEKTIKKYGGTKMFFAPPIYYDELMKKVPEVIGLQKRLLEEEGHTIISKGTKNIRYYVKDFEKSLIELKII